MKFKLLQPIACLGDHDLTEKKGPAVFLVSHPSLQYGDVTFLLQQAKSQDGVIFVEPDHMPKFADIKTQAKMFWVPIDLRLNAASVTTLLAQVTPTTIVCDNSVPEGLADAVQADIHVSSARAPARLPVSFLPEGVVSGGLVDNLQRKQLQDCFVGRLSCALRAINGQQELCKRRRSLACPAEDPLLLEPPSQHELRAKLMRALSNRGLQATFAPHRQAVLLPQWDAVIQLGDGETAVHCGDAAVREQITEALLAALVVV